MAATIEGIKSMLRAGANRRGPCFGAPDTNPTSPSSEVVSPEEQKERDEAARRLLEEFKW